MLSFPAQFISGSCIKIKINLKFLFSHVFVVSLDAPQRSEKIKIEVNFASSSGIGTGRINYMSVFGDFNCKLAQQNLKIFAGVRPTYSAKKLG